MIRREIQIFFTALMFYTRIPCPKWVNHDPDYLNKATRYFPLIGWIVGVVCWFAFIASRYLFSVELSIVISMLSGVLLTGAFHEDGFADVCDGFGGGWTKAKILSIMKDSRVGAYGVVGLILMLLFKFYSLQQLSLIDAYLFALMLVTSHAASRLMAVCIIFTSSYAREEADSKAKPVAHQLSVSNFFLSIVWVVIPLVFLVFFNPLFTIALVPSIIMTYYLRWYYMKWLGGYTGDCLGATQQINEVLIYVSLFMVWRFI